ncbi:MAG TPA: PKD domain-containing protein [Prolixibacteraceae bacterium]|nr:PKD domain-containing protein [Prolixibacteraceae bacterium]
MLLFAGFAKGTDTFTIKLNNSFPIQYCSDSVIVAPNLTINASNPIPGMKISITNGFISGEDELVYSGAVGTISGTWNVAQGTMSLQPIGSANSSPADYEKAIKSIVYKNNNPNPTKGPTIGTRKISITLIDADYLPATQHFYRFVTKPGILWTEAKDEAESNSMMYYGLRGYLATVTSQAENDFIRQKTKGVGWIGASDEATEENWRWVTGPEGLKDNAKGQLFWNGVTVSGEYTNWNSGEPNDSPTANIPHEEDYAHITFFPGDPARSYKWNDLANGGNTGDYVPAGYLIEFGGLPGDSVVELSATLDLQVNTITFNTDEIPAICEGESVTLNQPDNNANQATYLWSPAAGLSDPSIANPVARPLTTTKYTVTVTRGTCSRSYGFPVTVIPKPIVDFTIDPTTCYGYSLDVAYVGDANPDFSNFCWIFDKDTITSGTGSSFAQVNIPLGVADSNREITLLIVDQNGCSNQHTVSNILVKPDLSLPEVNATIQCQNESFDFSVVNPNPFVKYDWNFGDGDKAEGTNPTHLYLQPGKYTIQLTATNSDSCTNTVFIKDMVFATPLPVSSFSMDHAIVNKNMPTVNFLNSSTGAINYLWNFGDGTTSADENPSHNYTKIGHYRVLLKAESEYNCNDTISHPVTFAFDRIFPPNAFSPNASDPIDRIFLINAEVIISQGYHFMVLSRWDDIVFEVKDDIKGWDGKMKNGSFAPAGSYLWILYFTDSLGFKHQQKGTVTLVY